MAPPAVCAADAVVVVVVVAVTVFWAVVVTVVWFPPEVPLPAALLAAAPLLDGDADEEAAGLEQPATVGTAAP